MDADYDPSKSLQEELIDSSRKKRRRRRNKLAEAISKEKPKFDPSENPSYQAYLDQYYALDYEDMIGDQPCRFKYRNVVPNDYGLSVDEIIMADDKELNKWCSLKKALQHRPEHLELNDVRTYKQKARNEALKRKVFKSIYGPREGVENQEESAGPSNQQDQEASKKKRKRSKRKNVSSKLANIKQEKSSEKVGTESSINPHSDESKSQARSDQVDNRPEKKKRKLSDNGQNSQAENGDKSQTEMKDKSVESSEPSKKKAKKGKVEEKESTMPVEGEKHGINISEKHTQQVSKKKNTAKESTKKSKNTKSQEDHKNKKRGKNKTTHNKITKNETNLITDLSAERLKAYGINPKKFKNKLKYGKKN